MLSSETVAGARKSSHFRDPVGFQMAAKAGPTALSVDLVGPAEAAARM